jgi:hypothetical protein
MSSTPPACMYDYWLGGCHQPAAACEVHHLRHKGRGGVTSLENCILLVGWDRGALSGLLLAGFPDPPAAPGVRLSPHRALHVS